MCRISRAELYGSLWRRADDGLPIPLPDPTGRPQQGVRIRWIVYPASGPVRFAPETMSDRVYGHPVTFVTKATFTARGSYRVRAIASDRPAFRHL